MVTKAVVSPRFVCWSSRGHFRSSASASYVVTGVCRQGASAPLGFFRIVHGQLVGLNLLLLFGFLLQRQHMPFGEHSQLLGVRVRRRVFDWEKINDTTVRVLPCGVTRESSESQKR